MTQVAREIAPRPTFSVGFSSFASDTVEFRPRDTRFVLYDYLHDTPVGFLEYAWREIHKRYVRPLLVAPPDELEERFEQFGPRFGEAFKAISGALTIAFNQVSPATRERIRKSAGDSLQSFLTQRAPPRVGDLATHALITSLKTVRLVERAVDEAQREEKTAGAGALGDVMIAWAFAFSSVTLYLADERSRGKHNAVSLAFYASDYANGIYHTAKASGVLRVRQLPSTVRYQASDKPNEEDLLLAEAAAEAGGLEYIREEDDDGVG